MILQESKRPEAQELLTKTKNADEQLILFLTSSFSYKKGHFGQKRRNPFHLLLLHSVILKREGLRLLHIVLKVFSPDPFTDGRLGNGAPAVLPVGLDCRHEMSSVLTYYQEKLTRP